MKHNLLFTAALLLLSCAGGDKKRDSQTAIVKDTIHNFPSYDPDYQPPAGTQNIFELSQSYPDTFKTVETNPWTKVDFKTDYAKYMQSVLAYCLEGNTEVDFKVQDNKVRKWYHAPWLTYGLNGREYHHGLTRERPVPPGEIIKQQDVALENWAVGFYNEPGGYTIGKVWGNPTKPSSSFAEFPEGTVSFKLLFTAGPVSKIPFLNGSKEWTANVYRCNPEDRSLTPAQKAACIKSRYDTTVRLLQIDIAVKDKRAGATGWVFGTFIYDGSQNGGTVWEKMVPVGLMWGDDENVTNMINEPGAFINPSLKENLLNKNLIVQNDLQNGQQAYMSHHGLGGRLNGPVDNPISSCISCHSKAAVQVNGSPAPMADFSLTRATYTIPAFKIYFSTVPGGIGVLNIKGQQYYKLDYSLQLSAGIRNYYQSIIDSTRKADAQHRHEESLTKTMMVKEDTLKDLPEVTRNGLVNPVRQ